MTSGEITNAEILVLLTYAMALPLRGGLLSVSPAAFAGLGAYAFAVGTTHFGMAPSEAILLAVGLSLLGSAVLALPLSRIRGIYTSVATLALVVVFTSLESSLKLTGQTLGIYGIPFADMRILLMVAIIIVAGTFLWLDCSSLGRKVDLVAGDTVLAEISGMSVARTRMALLVTSSVVASFAGAIQAHSFFVVTPSQYSFFFGIQLTAYAVFGGTSFFVGPLIGGVFFSVLTVVLRGLPVLSELITGLIMAAVMVMYPEGISGLLRKSLRLRIGTVGLAPRRRPLGEGQYRTSMSENKT